jgi:hypothetical protein
LDVCAGNCYVLHCVTVATGQSLGFEDERESKSFFVRWKHHSIQTILDMSEEKEVG